MNFLKGKKSFSLLLYKFTNPHALRSQCISHLFYHGPKLKKKRKKKKKGKWGFLKSIFLVNIFLAIDFSSCVSKGNSFKNLIYLQSVFSDAAHVIFSLGFCFILIIFYLFFPSNFVELSLHLNFPHPWPLPHKHLDSSGLWGILLMTPEFRDHSLNSPWKLSV